MNNKRVMFEFVVFDLFIICAVFELANIDMAHILTRHDSSTQIVTLSFGISLAKFTDHGKGLKFPYLICDRPFSTSERPM